MILLHIAIIATTKYPRHSVSLEKKHKAREEAEKARVGKEVKRLIVGPTTSLGPTRLPLILTDLTVCD